MAIGFTGNGSNGSSIQLTVLGDGASTSLVVALKSACFAPWFTDSNSTLPLQLYPTTGTLTAYFDIPASGTVTPIGQPTVKAITYTLAIASGAVTFTFASAPPNAIPSRIISVGLLYP